MSKVIRVSDEVFTRLQRLAEPFVDTPSDVIETLLDDHDERFEGTEMDSSVPRETEGREAEGGPQLFLIPASRENANKTLEGSVSFDFAARFLDQDQVDQLEQALGGQTLFRCWAMTENSRSYWEAMNVEDIVLITVKGTGKFNFEARVATVLDSERLGEELWPVVPGEPWNLIYVLQDVKKIEIEKAKLVQSLGFSDKYVVPGTIRVDPDRLRAATERYGSLDELLAELKTG